MNSENKSCCNCTGKAAYAIAIIGAFLIVGFLVREMKKYMQAPPLNANRAAERAKALSEIRDAEADALNNTGWINPATGIVRLRIDDAMQLLEREWNDKSKGPAAARADLIARVEKANPPPPPPAPAKPSAFE
jgi:hypothetical protein